MDTTKFDHVATIFGQQQSRRTAMRTLTLAVLGAGAMRAIPGLETEARRKKSKLKKGKQGTGKVVECRQWVLSGGQGLGDKIGIDDDLLITLNGQNLLVDTDKVANLHAPISFPAKVGDTISVVATDTNPACRSLSPLWLHCQTSGKRRQLTNGQNDGCAAGRPANTVFFNQSFSVGL